MSASRPAALLGLLVLVSSCVTPPTTPWPETWEPFVGRTVTLEGWAADEKLGAMLVSDHGAGIWIDGLDAWPEGYYQGGDHGARVRVTGKVIRRDDLPAFVVTPGEPEKTGIPVESEADLETARVRYLLAEATWAPLD